MWTSSSGGGPPTRSRPGHSGSETRGCWNAAPPSGGSAMTASNLVRNWPTRAPRLLSVLRIFAAFTFMQFGTAKLFAFPGAIMPGGGTVPLASLVGLAGTLEAFGGLLLLVGLFTRPVAFVLAGEMAVAYFIGHGSHGFWTVLNQGTPAVIYCFVWLYLSAAGPGPWSLDARRGNSAARPLHRRGPARARGVDARLAYRAAEPDRRPPGRGRSRPGGPLRGLRRQRRHRRRDSDLHRRDRVRAARGRERGARGAGPGVAVPAHHVPGQHRDAALFHGGRGVAGRRRRAHPAASGDPPHRSEHRLQRGVHHGRGTVAAARDRRRRRRHHRGGPDHERRGRVSVVFGAAAGRVAPRDGLAARLERHPGAVPLRPAYGGAGDRDERGRRVAAPVHRIAAAE